VELFHVQALHVGLPPHELWHARDEVARKLVKSPPGMSVFATPLTISVSSVTRAIRLFNLPRTPRDDRVIMGGRLPFSQLQQQSLQSSLPALPLPHSTLPDHAP